MKSEEARTICTCCIWVCTSCTLIFGLFRMQMDFLAAFVLTAIVAGAAVGGTAIVWNATKNQSTEEKSV